MNVTIADSPEAKVAMVVIRIIKKNAKECPKDAIFSSLKLVLVFFLSVWSRKGEDYIVCCGCYVLVMPSSISLYILGD